MSYENGFLIVNGVLKEYIGTDTDVVIPDGVIGIGRGAFLKCKTLNKVAIPSSVRSIGEAAFPRRNIDIRVDQIATWCSLAIERDLFDGWFFDKWGYNLYIKDDLAQTIVVPTEIIDLGKYAFCRCLSLKNITLSEGIKTIGDRAFENCINLERV